MSTKPAKQDQKEPQKPENGEELGGNVQTVAEQLPEAIDTVRVRFKRGHPALAYSINEEADLPRALYEQHVGDGEFFEEI